MSKANFLVAAGTLFAASAAHAGDVQYDLRVDGMTCPFCVATSEKALKKIEGVKAVSTNLNEGVISVCADESVEFTDEQLRQLSLDKGFTYRSMTKDEGCSIEA